MRLVGAFLLSLFSFLSMTTCAARRTEQSIEFWGLGREGEVVAELIPEFEKETGIHVDIQQIPWTAAHEKILTAHVGNSLPDVAQVGNSWMSELVTVGAIVPIEEWQGFPAAARREPGSSPRETAPWKSSSSMYDRPVWASVLPMKPSL